MTTKKRISSLTIKGFKSIRHLEDFRLQDLNVLIGGNGVGKSNFVDYFRMLSEMTAGRLQVWVGKQGGADRLLSYGIKESPCLTSVIHFGGYGFSFQLEPDVDGTFVFTDEVVFLKQGNQSKEKRRASSGTNEAALARQRIELEHHGTAGLCFDAISSLRVYHFHDTSDTAGVKRWGGLHDNDFLRTDASNLAAYLYHLSREYPDVLERIERTVRLGIPIFDRFVFKPRVLPTQEEQVNLQWHQKNSDYILWPSQLSDGSIRFICLVTALLQPNPPSTIIIDEPELGLHPYAITLLGALLRSASKRMQVVVSTQSVPLVNEFELDDLVVVDREQGDTVFKRLNAADFATWLEDYTVGELWQKNILGGRPS